MEKRLRNRVMAITLIMGMAMVAFLGLAVNAEVEPPLAEPTVTVTDTFAPDNDMNAYVGDTFTFSVPGYDAPHNNANISAEITIGPLDPEMMTWNETNMEWVYDFTPDAPAYVGTHTVTIDVYDMNNMTNMNSTETMITIWHPVMLDTEFELPEFHEDQMALWNLSDAFLPEMDQAGNMLAFGVGPEGFPDGWTFTPVDHMGYTHWEVTPPANFSGMQDINVTATDTNGEMGYNVFTLDVIPVNDAPVIQEVIFEDMSYMPEWVNVTEMLNVTGVEGNFSWLVELEIDEDEMGVNFTVNVTDNETDHGNFTVDINDDIMDGIEVEWDSMYHMYNVTIDENLNGHFLVNYSVMDDDDEMPMDAYVWLLFTVEPVNDPPTVNTPDWDMMQYDIKTGEEINRTLTGIDDIDGDMVTVMWYIDGDMVPNWDETYFRYTWDTAGVYNVSARISDGTDTVDVGYFWANVTVANTAPTIVTVTLFPQDIDPFDTADFLLNNEVEEGEAVELTCTASDAEGDELTYTWTNNQDSAWSATGDTVIVPADYLQKGLTYTFTVEVSDGIETVSEDTITIKIVEKDDDVGFFENLGIACLIIMIGVPLLIIIIIIIIVVKKKGKKEEEMPPEEPPMGEEEMPMEGGEEMPPEGEVPMEGMEQPMMEQPVEEGVPAPEEPVPAPEEPAQEEPVPAPEEPAPAPEEPVPAPEEPAQEEEQEQPPAPPQPPMPPQ